MRSAAVPGLRCGADLTSACTVPGTRAPDRQPALGDPRRGASHVVCQADSWMRGLSRSPAHMHAVLMNLQLLARTTSRSVFAMISICFPCKRMGCQRRIGPAACHLGCTRGLRRQVAGVKMYSVTNGRQLPSILAASSKSTGCRFGVQRHACRSFTVCK